MTQEGLSSTQLNAVLKSEGAPWQAGDTPLSDLSEDELKQRLGYEPGPDEPSLDERIALSTGHLAEAGLTAAGAPASFDWRNRGGKNYITPVKNQGGCGSCVAFGTAAAVEGMVRIRRNNANDPVDFSEAHLFYCIAKSQGRHCRNGWWIAPALDGFKKPGIVDEACFPYTAGNQNCKLCKNWQCRVTSIPSWHVIKNTAAMKRWLSTRGPLVTAFAVYQDFSSYKSGIYKHVTGRYRGGHCVCCIGYNDTEGYWICKNSWGTRWGEGGYFKIAYGQCGIDAAMWAVDNVNLWHKHKKIIGLFATGGTRNAWAYIQGVGWRRVSYENDTIFFTMLTQLSAAKAAKRPVSLFDVNNVIKEIYVF
ncbi:MAG: C1 family peptidase [Acidobacteriota bacterium]|nr:C1 family peptidase [Acidobacteriota bacterium]